MVVLWVERKSEGSLLRHRWMVDASLRPTCYTIRATRVVARVTHRSAVAVSFTIRTAAWVVEFVQT